MVHTVKRGAAYGAFFGAVLGMVPSVILLLAASGPSLGVSGGEIASFWILSILGFSAGGAILGGALRAGLEVTFRKIGPSARLSRGYSLPSAPDIGSTPRDNAQDGAEANAGTSATDSSQRPEDLVAQGNALERAGQHEQALARFDRALDADETCSDAWYNKARVFVGLGRDREALECCDRALGHDPGNGEAWYTSALALSNTGRFSEAETRYLRAMDCFDATLASGPSNSEAWRAKGNVLAKLGRREEAIACFDRALAIDPQDTESWYQKGLATAQLPDPPEGTKRIHEALLFFDKASHLGHSKASQTAAHYRWLQIAP